MESKKTYFIIDDDIDDQELFIEAISEIDKTIRCIAVTNCDEALKTLQNPETALPDLIFLDLNMPKSDGLDVLRRVRATPRLADTLVGILTGSHAPNDELRASLLGATRYIHKSTSYPDYERAVRESVAEMLSLRR